LQLLCNFASVMSKVQFTTTIHRFEKQGEKTGWSYIEIPADVANKICPGNKQGFRTKGKLDNHAFTGKSLLPMGSGNFILPLNAAMRKAIGKKAGAMLKVQIEFDKSRYEINTEFMECLKDDSKALQFFKSLPRSHQNYFSKWIESAKTDATKAKRIAMAMNAFSKKQGFQEMMRAQRNNKIIS
jgi:Domain of unknown function (DUF1905)/Bacteriocin-protection, YdeI or OmpD-Associated